MRQISFRPFSLPAGSGRSAARPSKSGSQRPAGAARQTGPNGTGPADAEDVDPVADQVAASLDEILTALDAGRDPAGAMRSDRVEVVEPGTYDAPAVRAVRAKVGASQAVLAAVLGLSVEGVEHWEQGRRVPSGRARRLLDIAAGEAEAFVRRTIRRTEVGK